MRLDGWARPCENHFSVSCTSAILCLDTKSCRFKVCPTLAQKYNVPYDVCVTVAFLLEGDAFDHIVPDSVYYCEKLKVIVICTCSPLNCQSLSSRVANVQFCPVLPHGAATLSSIIVSQKPTQASKQHVLLFTRHTSHANL